MDANIVEIYCLADEFSLNFDAAMQGHVLQKDSGKRSRNRKFILSDSEIITILILFHLKQFRNLKAFYTGYIQVHCRNDFPHTVSYSRFVELQQKTVVSFTINCSVNSLLTEDTFHKASSRCSLWTEYI